MICNQSETGWEIIFQRAHALLAAKLVTYWRDEQHPLRWTETLNAIAQHDNGWQEWEAGERLTEAGTPRDFRQMPLELVLTQAERVVTRAWHQSMWIGLLVSRHLAHLYTSRRDELPALDAFLEEQEGLRARWREAMGIDQEKVDRAYSLLWWGDTLSLILCLQRLPFGERALEIATGPDGTCYDVVQREDGTVVVRPWPYERERFHVAIDVHHLEQVTFASEEELAAALASARVSRRIWELARGD